MASIPGTLSPVRPHVPVAIKPDAKNAKLFVTMYSRNMSGVEVSMSVFAGTQCVKYSLT
jgi:hypothetical protein